ncbi:MAG: peptide deformylase [Clostridia bacterium]|nr:peptide deformylase [Clostridia bacterium]MBR7137719.1 peptide deformylase [Clostridia bacterium]
MIREIVKDPLFLARKSLPATALDLPVARDLRDTLTAHRAGCVGMAANMIGVLKRIIVFADGLGATVMLNPEITKKTGPYETEEGCLSLEGVRPTTRFQTIRVRYQDESMRTQTKQYAGFAAQVIQHEIDHCDGILI